MCVIFSIFLIFFRAVTSNENNVGVTATPTKYQADNSSQVSAANTDQEDF